jgi:hypothetical protein
VNADGLSQLFLSETREGQQRIVGVLTIAASETVPCRRPFRIAAEPFGNATGKV